MSKREKFSEREYRTAYAESNLDSMIATQIRVLREQRDLSQRKLAELAGMKQSRISAMENVNYSSWTVGTLKRLAAAFDLPLVVRFESFGALLGEGAALTRTNLERPSFDEDTAFSGVYTTVSSPEQDLLEALRGMA